MRNGEAFGRLSVPRPDGGLGLGTRSFLPLAIIVILTAAAINAGLAQNPPPSGVLISLTSDRSELTVGDPVTLTIGVLHTENQAVVLPRIGPEWGPFEVQSQTAAQTISNGDGTRTTFQELQVTLFAPGEFETPNVPITVRNPDGSMEEVFSNYVRLTVTPVLAGPDEQLKDIRSPAHLSMPFWEQPAVLISAALAGLALLAVVSYVLYRRSRHPEALPELAPDPRTPWEVAAQELDRIAELDLPGRGNLKGHYTLVSGVLRVYVGATNLGDGVLVNASDMSTEEIVAAIWQSPLDHRNARLVVELLREADLVKFANQAPSVSRAHEAVAQVRDVLEATRPARAETARAGRPAGWRTTT